MFRGEAGEGGCLLLTLSGKCLAGRELREGLSRGSGQTGKCVARCMF